MSGNHGTESTSSESDSHAQDRTDLLGSRGFHVPRPKSRSNATNSIAVSTLSLFLYYTYQRTFELHFMILEPIRYILRCGL